VTQSLNIVFANYALCRPPRPAYQYNHCQLMSYNLIKIKAEKNIIKYII